MTREQVRSALESGAGVVRVHLIGVAGSGMSGLAGLLLALGHRVSGSDRVTTSETERLQKEGLVFSSPHTAGEVDGVDVVVYSTAIKAGNVAFDAAVARGIPLLRRAEALASIMRRKKGIVVAGTHGKTTTSAMAAHVLRGGGLEPSHYVGAEIPILGRNAQLGEGEYFVAEGDESDGTLVEFRPEISVVLNLEAEHLDHYGDAGIDGIKAVFRTLLEQTAGMVIYCGDDEGATSVCRERDASISYGLGEGCFYRGSSIKVLGQSSEFRVSRDGEFLGVVVLNIPGRHNILNSLAVIALTNELGVGFRAIADALATFSGAKRRFDNRFKSDDFRVVDDYGHHPTEVAATIEAARGLGAKRVLCVFQPHRYSRTMLLREEFGRAFDGVDQLFVTDVYAASEPPIEGISGETIVDAVNESGGAGVAVSTPGLTEATLAVGNALREGDLVLTLGAGDIHRVASSLARDLDVAEKLRGILGDDGGGLKLYEPMARHTTLLVGGPAQYWIEVRSVDGFSRVVRYLRAEGIPIRVVGRGSNLLVRDGGIRGAVVHPAKGEFGEVSIEGDLLTAGVGARFKKLASAAQAAGLGGFEWMEGIPGNVGGGLRMNAGAMGTETFDQVVRVSYLDGLGNLVTRERDEIDARYRNVPELGEHYAVSAVFRGQRCGAEAIANGLEESRCKRKGSQPVAASAGCIFKNPSSVPAGKLVDELGFKGREVGRAKVSEVHGNFIVNAGGAKARDVLGLIAEIKRAAEQRGIELETEVQIIGQDEPIV